MNSFTLDGGGPVDPQGPSGPEFFRCPLSATYEWVVGFIPTDGGIATMLGIIKKGLWEELPTLKDQLRWLLENRLVEVADLWIWGDSIYVGKQLDMGLEFWFQTDSAGGEIRVFSNNQLNNSKSFIMASSKGIGLRLDVTKVFAQLLECAHRTAYAAGFADGKIEGFKASYAVWHRQS